MTFGGINYIAVVVAAIAAFAFGALYYTTFAKRWLAALGKTEEELMGGGPNPWPYIFAAIAQLVMAWMLAGVIGHLGTGQVTLANAVLSAAMIWVGFVMTTMVVNHRFQAAKWSLTLIDGGHWLGALLIQGAVIGLFGV